MHIISISRGSLSGTINLADHLSLKIKTPIISRERVLKEAEKYGIKETGLIDFTFIDRAPSVWDKSSFRKKHYLLSFLTSFLDIALQDSIIYVGHLAHILLTGIPFLLRIRVIHSEENRINLLMAENNMDHDQAANYIKTIDERRQKWSNYLYGVNLENPVYYDLILNLDNINVETASDVISTMISKREFQSSPESIQLLRNFHLATKAKLFLHLSPLTRGTELEVEANAMDGSLFVKGECPYMDDDKCEQKVKMVLSKLEGVNSIKFIKSE